MKWVEDGTPFYWGERVHLTNPVMTLNDNLIFDPGHFEVYVTDFECCTELLDFNIIDDPVPAGTIYDVTGTVDFFNGKTVLTDLELVDLGGGELPEPTEITTGELASNGEAYEGCLVRISGLEIVGGDPWPEEEGSDANVEVDDGSGPVIMRIDKDTEIDGSPAPEQPFTAIGCATQYDTEAPYFDDYQLLPRNLDDILYPPTPTSQLASFRAHLSERSVILTWEANPLVFSGFEIRRRSLQSEGQSETVMLPATRGQRTYSWTDRDIENGQSYSYTLEGRRVDASSLEAGPVVMEIPLGWLPNLVVRSHTFGRPPFRIRYNGQIPDVGLQYRIYDPLGRLVRALHIAQGERFIQWNGRDCSGREVAAGIYHLVTLSSEKRVGRTRIVVLH